MVTYLAGRITIWDAQFLNSIQYYTHRGCQITIDDRRSGGGGEGGREGRRGEGRVGSGGGRMILADVFQLISKYMHLMIPKLPHEIIPV